jgi:hypothetical protein
MHGATINKKLWLYLFKFTHYETLDSVRSLLHPPVTSWLSVLYTLLTSLLSSSLNTFFFPRAKVGSFNAKQNNNIFREEQIRAFNIIKFCFICFMLAAVFWYKLIHLKSNNHYDCGYWILNLFLIALVGIVSPNKLSLFPAAFLKSFLPYALSYRVYVFIFLYNTS